MASLNGVAVRLPALLPVSLLGKQCTRPQTYVAMHAYQSWRNTAGLCMHFTYCRRQTHGPPVQNGAAMNQDVDTV